MLRLSTRLFAAGTLAALLVGINQDGFAHEKSAKSASKTGAMTCCTKKDGVKSCDKAAASSKTAAAKSGKVTAKTVSNAKVAPKTAAKTKAVQTATKNSADTAVKPGSCCQQVETHGQPA